MGDTREDKVWPAFRRLAIKFYGKTRFSGICGKYQLQKVFDRWLSHQVIGNETDVEDASQDFMQLAQDIVGEGLPPLPTRYKRGVPYVSKRGSLQSIAAYAEALPIVLKARQEVLGHREPLSNEEAVEWLEREMSEPVNDAFVEVTYCFRVPNTGQVLQGVVAGAFEQGDKLPLF